MTDNQPERVSTVCAAVTNAMDKLATNWGVSYPDIAAGTLLAAITVASRVLGPPATVEWLRDFADRIERKLLDAEPPAPVG